MIISQIPYNQTLSVFYPWPPQCDFLKLVKSDIVNLRLCLKTNENTSFA